MSVEPEALTPFDVTLEQAILGAMIVRPGMIDRAAGEIEARHFYDPLHGRIFDMAVHLQSEGDVSPHVLASVLRNDPAKSENLSPSDYVMALASFAPAIPAMPAMCAQLKDLALRRRLHQIGGELAKLALDNPDGLKGAALAENATEALLEAGIEGSQKPLTPYEIAQETVRELESAKHGQAIPVTKTGISPLDAEIGGLRGGDFVTILGKSSMGKSALLGKLSLGMAMSGVAVIVFSLEMKRRQWIDRIVCDIAFDNGASPLWYSSVRNHDITDEQFKRYVLASQHLENLPMEICDDDGLTMAQISARARAFAAKHRGKRIAVIGDYLQIVEPADPKENRERQVARIARGGKSLAKRLDCPVIFGSQMNESDSARSKEERRPRASDARESRGIMNESDFMFAPYRPVVAVEDRRPVGAAPGSPELAAWYADKAEVINVFELLCLKNRHGRRFDLTLWADMGANAIRDEAPGKGRPAQDEENLQQALGVD